MHAAFRSDIKYIIHLKQHKGRHTRYITIYTTLYHTFHERVQLKWILIAMMSVWPSHLPRIGHGARRTRKITEWTYILYRVFRFSQQFYDWKISTVRQATSEIWIGGVKVTSYLDTDCGYHDSFWRWKSGSHVTRQWNLKHSNTTDHLYVPTRQSRVAGSNYDLSRLTLDCTRQPRQRQTRAEMSCLAERNETVSAMIKKTKVQAFVAAGHTD